MKKRALPILLVVAMLITALAITAMAAETPVASNNVSSYANTDMKGNFDEVTADGTVLNQYCPVCNKTIAKWYELNKGQTGTTALGGYHYFLSTNITHSGSGFYRIPANTSTCIYLNGNNISNAAYIPLQVMGGATLNLIGNGTEVVSGGGLSSASYGATVDVRGGTLNLFGGTYQKTEGTTRTGPVIGCSEAAGIVNIYNGTTVTGGVNSGIGGNIGLYYAGSALNIYGGTISNGQAANGGNIGVTGGVSAVNISGGTIEGGQANFGGNIYGDSSVTFTVNSGSTIRNGKANQGNNKLGGNFYIENAFLVINGGEISGGSAVSGGNLYLSKYMGGIGGITTTAGTISGGSATNGGSIYLAGGTATLKGLSISGGNATSQGGNIFSAGTLTLDSCNISGGTSTYQGGSIYANSGSTLTLTNTTVDGGQTTNSHGGSLGLEKATVEIINSTVKNGNAKSYGGCIYAFSGGTLNIDAGSKIENGSASVGGNLFAEDGCVVDLFGDVTGGETASTAGSIRLMDSGTTMHIHDGAVVSGGKTSYDGGNIELSSGTVLNVYEGAVIKEGNAGRNGGNICAAGATLAVTGGSISDGQAKSGGNLFTTGTGSVNLSNATVENGTAGTGGNAYLNGTASFTSCVFNVAEAAVGTGTQFFNDVAVTLDDCTLNGGSVYSQNSVTAKGSVLAKVTITGGTMTLQGETNITDLVMSKSGETFAKLVVDTTFSGTANVTGLADGAATYGEKLAGSYTANGDFTGKVILAAMDAKPWVFHDDGGLVVGNARTVKEEGEDKIVTWHKDNAAAAQNYGDADYMYPGNHDLPLAGGNYVVNVSGWTMNVTGTGNVTFYDTANADFTTYGTVTVNGPAVSNTFATVGPDGYTYYMVKENDTYSFHRVSVKVNGVSIRPSVAGIYYTSVWQCDAKLAEKIQSFGVAVSLKDQPTDGFRNDGDTLFTKFLKDEFESGKTMTSVLISNILAVGKDNADRATKSIYATAYIILDDGTEAGTVAVDGNDVNFSLKQAMELIDSNTEVYLDNKTQVDNFYNTWKTVMESWNFQNIGKDA